MGRIRIPVVIIVFAITLTLLLLGQRFVFRQHMLSNLEAEFLDTTGVKTAHIKSDADGLSLVVELQEGIGFKIAYDEMLRLSKQAGIPPERIFIQDSRGPILSEALYAIHYAVEEGIATGRFQLMVNSVENELAHRGIEDYEIWVGPQFVCLAMHHGPEHLYQVFARNHAMAWKSVEREG
ncbi:MAG: hypothetical protein GX998_04035 [Firmicutes bacterium]|nr:hypothetical protein [Bacillota bacterium]